MFCDGVLRLKAQNRLIELYSPDLFPLTGCFFCQRQGLVNRQFSGPGHGSEYSCLVSKSNKVVNVNILNTCTRLWVQKVVSVFFLKIVCNREFGESG